MTQKPISPGLTYLPCIRYYTNNWFRLRNDSTAIMHSGLHDGSCPSLLKLHTDCISSHTHAQWYIWINKYALEQLRLNKRRSFKLTGSNRSMKKTYWVVYLRQWHGALWGHQRRRLKNAPWRTGVHWCGPHMPEAITSVDPNESGSSVQGITAAPGGWRWWGR